MNKAFSLSQGRWFAVYSLAAMLLTLFCAAQETTPGKGLVIHRHSPSGSDRLAEATEYTKVEVFPQVTNVTLVGGGSQMRILNDRVVEVIEYADLSTGTIITEAQIHELKAKPAALGVLAKRFPKAYERLVDEARRINSAVQMLDQGKVLVAGRWQDKDTMSVPSPATGETLTVSLEDGQSRTFTGVRVTGQEPDSLRIMHSRGAATIPYEQLSEKDQQRYGFDPARAEGFRQQKGMAQRSPSADIGISGDYFVGTWEIVPNTANTMNLLGKDMTYLFRYKLAGDGTMASFQKVLENGVTKSDWEKSEDHMWKLVGGTFTDTGKRWVGFVIEGLAFGGVFVLREGKLVHTKNSAAVSQLAASGRMRDTNALTEFELEAIRNISTDDLAGDDAEDYLREEQQEPEMRPTVGRFTENTEVNLSRLDPDNFPDETEPMRFLAANIHRIKFETPPNLSPSLRRAGFTLEFRPSEFAATHFEELMTAKNLRSEGKLEELWNFAKNREKSVPAIRGESPEQRRLRALTYFRVRLFLKGDQITVEDMKSKGMAVMGLGISNDTGLLKHQLAREVGWQGWSGSSYAEVFRDEQMNPLPGNIGYAIEWNFSNGDVYVMPTAGLDAHLLEHFPDVAEDYYSDSWNVLNDLKLDMEKLMGLGELNDSGAQQRVEKSFSQESDKLISLFNRR